MGGGIGGLLHTLRDGVPNTTFPTAAATSSPRATTPGR